MVRMKDEIKDLSIKAFINQLKLQLSKDKFDAIEIAKVIQYLKAKNEAKTRS